MKHRSLTMVRIPSIIPVMTGVLTRIVLFACVLTVSSADTTRTVQDIVPGLTLTQEITTGDHPLIINCLRVDLKTKSLHVRCGQALDAISLSGPAKGREQLHSLTSRNGAIAGINADYFPFTGDALGLEVRDGELMSEPMEYRACLGLTSNGVHMAVLSHYGALDMADGTPLSLAGINRAPQTGEIVALCPVFNASPRITAPACIVTLANVNLPVSVSKPMQGVVTSVTQLPPGSVLPICPPGGTILAASGIAASRLLDHSREGDVVHFRFDLITSGPAPTRGKYASRSSVARGQFQPVWADVVQAVGGGPWMVRGGQIQVDWENEGLNKVTFVDRRHPRTAAGVTADNVLLMVAVDGRSPVSQGVTLDEMAAIMKTLGAMDAINLDGGGSSTMVVQDVVVNAPSDGRERPIADGLLVYSDAKPENGPTPAATTVDAPIVVHAGDSIPLTVHGAIGALPDSGSILWGTGDGLGFVNQRGQYGSVHAGTGSILARYHGTAVTIPVTVLPAEASVVRATMAPIANYPPYYTQITVTITDRFGNPIPGTRVSVEIAGGTLDGELTTASNGQATAQIVWDVAPEKRVVKIYAAALKPIFVKQSAGTPKVNSSQDPDDR